jgi:hypothetical protein
MKMRAPFCLLIALLAIPQTAFAQNFGIGARIGTLGFGAEAALGLSDHFVVRGGLGSFMVDFDADFEDLEYTVTPPSMTGTLGIDLYPMGGTFRIMGGLMFRGEDFRLDSCDLAECGPVEIGDEIYDVAGTLHGELETKSPAPFLGIGFGRHTSGGFGVTFDLGVAFLGEPDVVLTALGPLGSEPGIQESLDQEAQTIEDDLGKYYKYWPILSFGVKIPIG